MRYRVKAENLIRVFIKDLFILWPFFILFAALVDMLIAKTKSWEEERKKPFLYDEVRT